MTGPEHYREAERLLAGIKTAVDAVTAATKGDVSGLTDALTGGASTLSMLAAKAQAHATLALAAATAYPAIVAYVGQSDEDESRGWAGVTS